MSDDTISRQDVLDSITANITQFNGIYTNDQLYMWGLFIRMIQEAPSAQPEIIRCKDCRWWNKYGDYDNGYCVAAKHGYWSEHWEISIRRTYKGDFYCADAEMRGEQDE